MRGSDLLAWNLQCESQWNLAYCSATLTRPGHATYLVRRSIKRDKASHLISFKGLLDFLADISYICFSREIVGVFVIPEAANNIIYIHSRACMDLEKRRTMIQQAPVKILSFCKCNRLYLFNSSSNNEYQQQEFGMRVILISWRCVKIQPDFEYSHNHATEQYDTRYMLHVRSKFLFFGQTNSLNSHH